MEGRVAGRVKNKQKKWKMDSEVVRTTGEVTLSVFQCSKISPMRHRMKLSNEQLYVLVWDFSK